jgi:hypothetical protein
MLTVSRNIELMGTCCISRDCGKGSPHLYPASSHLSKSHSSFDKPAGPRTLRIREMPTSTFQPSSVRKVVTSRALQ